MNSCFKRCPICYDMTTCLVAPMLNRHGPTFLKVELPPLTLSRASTLIDSPLGRPGPGMVDRDDCHGPPLYSPLGPSSTFYFVFTCSALELIQTRPVASNLAQTSRTDHPAFQQSRIRHQHLADGLCASVDSIYTL